MVGQRADALTEEPINHEEDAHRIWGIIVMSQHLIVRFIHADELPVSGAVAAHTQTMLRVEVAKRLIRIQPQILNREQTHLERSASSDTGLGHIRTH